MKTEYDKLVAKVNSIDNSGFVLKTKYDRDKSEIENKIPDTSGLVKKTDYNAKITEIEGKIPSISGLATNAALTVVENKIPKISSLVKQRDYKTKITEIEKKLTDHNDDKYNATEEFNTLAVGVFNARLSQANLITKTVFDAKLSSLNKKITTNKSKHLIVQIELKELKTFDLSYFIVKCHFWEDGTENYLVFQPIYRYYIQILFQRVIGVGTGNYIYFWKSKGLSNENITSLSASDYSLNPQLGYLGTKIYRKLFKPR